MDEIIIVNKINGTPLVKIGIAHGDMFVDYCDSRVGVASSKNSKDISIRKDIKVGERID